MVLLFANNKIIRNFFLGKERTENIKICKKESAIIVYNISQQFSSCLWSDVFQNYYYSVILLQLWRMCRSYTICIYTPQSYLANTVAPPSIIPFSKTWQREAFLSHHSHSPCHAFSVSQFKPLFHRSTIPRAVSQHRCPALLR